MKRKKRASLLEKLRKLEDPTVWTKLEKSLAASREAYEDRCKDAVLHMRINSKDLERLKKQAKSKGLKYQTYIAEILKNQANR